MGSSLFPESVLLFGLGYTGGFITRALQAEGVEVIATRRSVDGVVRRFSAEAVDTRLRHDLSRVDAVISCIPPDKDGDAAARWLAGLPQEATGHLQWLGYLSSTGVYPAGEVNEATPVAASDDTARARILAEQQWQALTSRIDCNNAIFRLPAIYGPGRNALTQLVEGKARLIDAPHIRFNRIHVEDIARIVQAAMARPRKGAVYLPCDELPASHADVLRYAAALSGLALPPAQTLDNPTISAALRRFYDNSKTIDNRKTRAELAWQPRYRDYRQGLNVAWYGRGEQQSSNMRIQSD